MAFSKKLVEPPRSVFAVFDSIFAGPQRGSEMTCRLVAREEIDFDRLNGFPDRNLFQTPEWVDFIRETQGAEPVFAELRFRGQLVGYFTGLVVSRFGVKILGSPFPGWTTPFMGFNLVEGASRRDALAAVEAMAWSELKCLHMEVCDPALTFDDAESLGFATDTWQTFLSDLRKSEDELFASMDSACRRCIRKAEKSGVTIEEASDPGFADEYYEQLLDVFAKQGLTPTYDLERVRALVRHLQPTGNLLLLRARDPEGKCIATGIYPGMNKVALFWGNASHRSGQHLRPNQLLHWSAMRYWKNRGVEVFDWGGAASYKSVYGCVRHKYPWLRKSRYRIISTLRNEARRLFDAKRKLQQKWLSAGGD